MKVEARKSRVAPPMVGLAIRHGRGQRISIKEPLLAIRIPVETFTDISMAQKVHITAWSRENILVPFGEDDA